jgi:hypothetical protein
MAEQLSEEQLQKLLTAPTEEIQQAAALAAPASRPTDFMRAPAPEMWQISLPDGRTVQLQRPTRPVNLLVAKALGNHSSNAVLNAYYRAACWIRGIDGMGRGAPNTAVQFEAVLNDLGDDGMDEVLMAVNDKMDEIAAAMASKGEVKN